MALPEFDGDGFFPRGIHTASLLEVIERFGAGSLAREQQAELLRQVVEAAKGYPTIKRVLVWGSYVTSRPKPNDLDYSIVVSLDHKDELIADTHRRFFVPLDARIYYGLDRGYLEVYDYPVDNFAEHLNFLCRSRLGDERGTLHHSRFDFNDAAIQTGIQFFLNLVSEYVGGDSIQ